MSGAVKKIMSEQNYKRLSLLTLSVLLLGAVLPASIGFVFADDQNQGQGQGQEQGGQDTGDQDDDDGGDEDVPASEIPDLVMSTALSSLPQSAGVTAADLHEAEWDADDKVYELKFKKSGQEFKVEIRWVDSAATLLEAKFEDDEADESLGSHEDEDSVDITSTDNSIEFSKEKPKVEFRVRTGNATTELKFEAEFKSLVEFTDSNNSSRLDKGEAVFKLDFDELNWEVTTSTNSSMTVTYSASTTIDDREYKIRVELMVPQSEGADIVTGTLYVDKWSWQEGGDANLLALVSELEAKVEADGEVLPEDAVKSLEGVDGVTLAIETNPYVIKYTFENKPEVGASAYIAKLEKEFKSEISGDESESEAKTEMDAIVVFRHFTDSLVYDPSFGFIDDPVKVAQFREAIQRVAGIGLLSSTTLLYTALAVSIVAIALVVVGRRISLNHAFPAR